MDRRRGGFALLVTIVLVSFLVLLLVGLATFTRVETQVAINAQHQAQARQNALMALNIAVGQLQKYAGPDQRVTARADIDSSLANTTTQSGRWLGAYGRAVAAADATTRDLYGDIPSKIQADVAANSDTKGNQAVLLNWLVSGNENTVFNPSTAVDANGQIPRSLAPSAFEFAQTDAVALGGATALSPNVTVKAKPARLLVGPGSAASAADYVAAPLVPVSANVPGMGGTPVPIANYAWWVGDENAKARVNLPLATNARKPQAFVSAQRAAIELMDGVHPASSATANAADLIGYNSAYNPAQPNLSRVLALQQLPMLSSSQATTLASAVKYRFHDLTSSSYSVLSDTYAGGLRKDMSALLASDYTAPSGGTMPADTDFLIAPETNSTDDPTNEYGLPTWGLLRSFVQTVTPASGGLNPAPATMQTVAGRPVPVPTSMGVSPVMTYATLGFQYAAPNGDVIGNPINLAVFPIVVLWNPYTTAINGNTYEVGLKKTFADWIELQGHSGPVDSAYVWSASDVIEARRIGFATSSTDRYFRFIIDNPEGIPAGQSLVFTLQKSGDTYTPADASNPLRNTTYKPLAHVLMPSTRTITLPPGSTYRVGVNGVDPASASPSSPTNGVPKTLWTNNTANMGGGNGWQDAYLAKAGEAPDASSRPYTGTGPFVSKQWYQGFNLFNSPFATVSPYKAAQAGGYPVANVKTGLVQNEGPLTVVTSPAFRIPMRALFGDAESSNYVRIRWIAQTNPRALMFSGTPSSSATGNPSFVTGRPNQATWPPDLSVHAATRRTSAGTSLTDTGSGPIDVSLFEFRPHDRPFMTLGQLQQANLTWSNAYPAYLVGNSTTAISSAPDQLVSFTGGKSQSDPANLTTARYDLAWLVNRSLWDRYFVSTIPYAGTGTGTDTHLTTIPGELANPLLVRHGAPSSLQLRDADQAAARLLISGGFNINSTSEQAWRAILGGMNQLSYDSAGAGGPAFAGPVFSRFVRPTTNSTANGWQGYRQLTTEQIAQLATNIVAEIRRRGPFVSLGDFVNRRLVDNGPFPLDNDKRLKGTLQAAIDATTTGATAINNAATPPFNSPLVNGPGTPVTDAFISSSASSAGVTRTAPYSSTSAFAPQFLTQADVLTAIGSALSARSDTFTVRAYGESINPTDPADITGRAWCEAIVQRVPDYVDSGADPQPHNPPTAQINKTMGRRFKIVSFRWLSPSDI